MDAPTAVLLDLTRLVSRLGRGPLTGIDRVELAYLDHLLDRPGVLFALVRTALGFVLLDRAGAQGVRARIAGKVPIGRADLLGRISNRRHPMRARAEAELRRLALSRCLRGGLPALLRRNLPQQPVYVNVGHSNLTAQVTRAVKAVPGARIVVMVHDTIPLDHPEFCRPGTPSAFGQMLAVVSADADLVVHTAQSTRQATDAHLARMGRVPDGLVAPLGVSMAVPEASALASVRTPCYVALGTIEPRKNIGLLVKVWTELQKADAPPHLYIIGHRGWAEPALFAELDRLVATGSVSLLQGLGDAAAMAVLQASEALLFPSLAEGFGLPPLEAAALGVPVLAGTLPVVVEMLGDYPVYLDTSDVYAWVETIKNQMRHRKQRLDAERQVCVPPRWADHFDIVFGKA